MEEPLSAEMPGFEPGTGPIRLDSWRVRTNFVRARDILERFSVWPDDVLNPVSLEALYTLKIEYPLPQYSINTDRGVLPAFPFLDEAEGARISALFSQHESSLYSPFREVLTGRTLRGGPAAQEINPGLVSLALEIELVQRLKDAERVMGIWEERSPGQRLGTIFAVRPDVTVPFTIAEVIPVREGSAVLLPWGGAFFEYGKLLHLLDNRYARMVMGSCDVNMEVVPEGHVLKKMTGAGLLRAERQAFLDSHWKLALGIVRKAEAAALFDAIATTADKICASISPALQQIKNVMREGRYYYLDGHGDYFEMAYSVLVGLLMKWAVRDGFFSRPPKFRVIKDAVTIERGFRDRLKGIYPDLVGLSMLEDPQSLWTMVTGRS